MSKALTVQTESFNDTAAAEMLTAQYEKAVRGELETIVLGAMLSSIRMALMQRAVESGGNFNEKGGGLNGWIAEHCPKISLPTAHRWMNLATGIAEVLSIGPKVDFVALLTTPENKLAPALQKKRAALEKFIEGKSQNAIRSEIAKKLGTGEAPKRTGGDNEFQAWLKKNFPTAAENGFKLKECSDEIRSEWAAHLKRHELPPDEIAKLNRENAKKAWWGTLEFLRERGLGRKRTWPLLDPTEIEAIASLLADLAAEMKHALKKT